MEIENSEDQIFTIPIPRIFHSFFHEGMFPTCSVCEKNLLEDEVSYYIEKAYQRGEVAFEYAMCDECKMSMGEELSMESMMNLANYFMEHGDLLARREKLIADFDNNIKPWVNECLFTGKLRSECESYQICAECEGTNLVVSFLPFMISSDAVEEIQQLISKKTRDSFDGFVRDVLNPPVDFKDIPILI